MTLLTFIWGYFQLSVKKAVPIASGSKLQTIIENFVMNTKLDTLFVFAFHVPWSEQSCHRDIKNVLRTPWSLKTNAATKDHFLFLLWHVLKRVKYNRLQTKTILSFICLKTAGFDTPLLSICWVGNLNLVYVSKLDFYFIKLP